MPIRQPFYLNANNLYSATSVFLDAALTLPAIDGFYSDGNAVRELVNGIFLPIQGCLNCCDQPCTSWRAVGPAGQEFALKYGGCGNRGVEITYAPDGGTIDVCVKGTTTNPPNVLIGNAELSINQNCGCCVGPCETWKIRNVTQNVTVSYKTCEGVDTTQTVLVGFEADICIKSGTLPTVVTGDAILRFSFCDCI